MKQSFYLIIISIFLLSGCSSAVDQTPTKAITPGPTRYATKEITILPSITPDSHGLKVIQSSPVFQETLIIPPTYGILLTDELNADQEDRYYGIDSIKILLLEDYSEKTIFIDNVSSVELLSVSPDNKHIAFEKSTDRPLADYVIDTRGNIVYSRTWLEEEFPYLVGWLDDESIILGISSPSLTPFTTKIVDIFNNDEIVLDPSILPDITHGGYYGYRFWHNYSFVEAVYSPD